MSAIFGLQSEVLKGLCNPDISKIAAESETKIIRIIWLLIKLLLFCVFHKSKNNILDGL